MPIAPNSIVLCGRTRGESQAIDTLMFALRCGPVVGLSALTGDLASGEKQTIGGKKNGSGESSKFQI